MKLGSVIVTVELVGGRFLLYCIANLYEIGGPNFKSQLYWWQVLTVLTLPMYMKQGSLALEVEFLSVRFLLYKQCRFI